MRVIIVKIKTVSVFVEDDKCAFQELVGIWLASMKCLDYMETVSISYDSYPLDINIRLGLFNIFSHLIAIAHFAQYKQLSTNKSAYHSKIAEFRRYFHN